MNKCDCEYEEGRVGGPCIKCGKTAAFRDAEERGDVGLVSDGKDIPIREILAYGSYPVLSSLETGQYYWYRTKPDLTVDADVWRPCYVGQDPDGVQWFHGLGLHVIEVSHLNLNNMEFIPLEKPQS